MNIQKANKGILKMKYRRLRPGIAFYCILLLFFFAHYVLAQGQQRTGVYKSEIRIADSVQKIQLDRSVLVQRDNFIKDSILKEGIQLSMGVTYERKIDTVFITKVYREVDTLVIPEADPLIAMLSFKLPNGGAEKTRNILLNYHFVVQSFQLLPLVFFRNNSSTIPAKYLNDKDRKSVV
jgi:hypothetical protein